MKKCCTKCSVEKPLTEFYKHKKMLDGLENHCKQCRNLNSKIYYSTNLDSCKNVRKEYQKNNFGKWKGYIKKWATKKSGVYEWYEGDISLYIGQSKQLNQRLSNHKSYFNNPELAKKNKTHGYLYPLLRQHQNPQIHIIEECSPEILLEREQYYIDIKKPLYNKNNI